VTAATGFAMVHAAFLLVYVTDVIFAIAVLPGFPLSANLVISSADATFLACLVLLIFLLHNFCFIGYTKKSMPSCFS
jgi:hypothetical protein